MTLVGGMQADDTTDTLVAPLEPGTYWALDFNTNNPDKFFVFTVAGGDSGNEMPAQRDDQGEEGNPVGQLAEIHPA